MKRCSNKECSSPSPEFHKRAASRDGYAARCTECINEANRDKYDADPEFRAKKIVQAQEYRRAS